ncbi:MAG: hypothetical protein L0Y32_00995, partial [Nevskiales bacterium]|nr:hypothetical protein [Nevskiales bacterium]
MFVLWGAYHAGLLVLYRVCPPLTRLETGGEATRAPAVALMFVLTLFGWLIFRSSDAATFFALVQALGQWSLGGAAAVKGTFVWILMHVVPLLVLQWVSRAARDEAALDHRPWWNRGLDYTVLFVLVATAAVIDVEFIYFQF